MQKLKCYPTYQGAVDAERHREKQWRRTKQGAFESSFVSFEETKEPFYPLGAVVRRAYDGNGSQTKHAYMRAYSKVMRLAPECLEVFRLILKNGKDRQKSICEMMTALRERNQILKRNAYGKTCRQRRSTR